jgi:thiazole synthase
MSADPVLAKRLEKADCAAVVPFGAAIGSGQALTMSMLKQIIRDTSVPVIVDAGLRSPFAAAVRAGRDAWRADLMTRSETAAATSPLTAFLAGGPG